MKTTDIQLHQSYVHVRGAEPYTAWDAVVVVPLDKAGGYMSRPERRKGDWQTSDMFVKTQVPSGKGKSVIVLRHTGRLGDVADDMTALESVDLSAIEIDQRFDGDPAVGGGIDETRWTLETVPPRNIIAPLDEYLATRERHEQQKRDAAAARVRRESEAQETRAAMDARLKSFGVSATTYEGKVSLSFEETTRLLDRLAAAESADAQAS